MVIGIVIDDAIFIIVFQIALLLVTLVTVYVFWSSCFPYASCCNEKIVTIEQSLVKIPYSRSTFSHLADNCTICLNDFREQESTSSLHCNIVHIFHTECIRQWLLMAPSLCPLCKAKFNPREQKKSNQSFYRRLKTLNGKIEYLKGRED